MKINIFTIDHFQTLVLLIKKYINKIVHENFFTNTQKQTILIGIACDMKYLHECYMIHRDISLSNI